MTTPIWYYNLFFCSLVEKDFYSVGTGLVVLVLTRGDEFNSVGFDS